MTVVHEKLLEKVEGQPEKGYSRSTPMELHASYVYIESLLYVIIVSDPVKTL
jgi:hypothetical protein